MLVEAAIGHQLVDKHEASGLTGPSEQLDNVPVAQPCVTELYEYDELIV